MRQAQAFLEVAQMVATEKDTSDDEYFNHVAAGVAVLAVIAASDALCCHFLRERSRGQSHREAIDVLATVRFGSGGEDVRAARSRG